MSGSGRRASKQPEKTVFTGVHLKTFRKGKCLHKRNDAALCSLRQFVHIIACIDIIATGLGRGLRRFILFISIEESVNRVRWLVRTHLKQGFGSGLPRRLDIYCYAHDDKVA